MKIKRLVVFLLIICALGVFSFFYPNLTGNAIDSSDEANYKPEPAVVLRIIDGDTIETDLGAIRLLGINTPEKGKHGYDEAKQFLISQIENQTIELLRDKTNKDKYDRFLRYVFYEGRFLNIEILENGLASAYMTEDLQYEEKLLRAQEYAKKSELGIWQKSNNVCAQCIILAELNATEEFFIINNICDYDCNLNDWSIKDAGRNTFKLDSTILKSGEEKKIESSKSVWNDDGDEFFMTDEKGLLVIYYSYIRPSSTF